MCENVNLTLNFFESRNTNVISSLLDLNDNVVETLSETEFKWVAGNSLRAHGGFVKKISGDDNFKAYILPNVAKLSFEKLKVSDIKNNDDEFDVSGNNTELTFRLEDKEVVYRLCAESILDVENELPDNDEEQVEEEAEINRGLEGAENANANQVIQEVNENENVDVPANENENVDVPADENENVDVPANADAEGDTAGAEGEANADADAEGEVEKPKGLLERVTDFVNTNLSGKEKEEEKKTGPLESPELKEMSFPNLNGLNGAQNNNAVPPQEMNATNNQQSQMPASNNQQSQLPASNNQQLQMPASNNQQSQLPASNNQQLQLPPFKVPEQAMNVPTGQTTDPNPSQPAMPNPAMPPAMPPAMAPAMAPAMPPAMPPAMAGGNYYENSIKENFQIGNARTNRNKSRKKRVKRGTSLSKRGGKNVKVL